MTQSTDLYDVSIMYSGGSGGFLLLHLLLLSGWQAGFQQDLSLNEILQKQWDVKSLSQWKHSEITPDNQLTIKLSGPRLYFYCNPPANQKLPTEKIITIYTDIQSQLCLSKAKKAHWFGGPENNFEQREFNRIQEQHYAAVRDPSWPIRLTDATEQQLQEMQQDPFWQQLESTGNWENFIISSSSVFNNIRVDSSMFHWLLKSTHAILLQDLVNAPHMVFSKLNLVFTPAHQQLLDHWISLHPSSLLQSVGITSRQS